MSVISQIPPVAWILSYTHWLHGKWPAGKVEKLPEVQPDGSTNVPGIYVVGDLTGIPLLKFSSDTGARVIETIAEDSSFQSTGTATDSGDLVDVAVIGSGVSGMSAAIAAKQQGWSYVLFEAQQPFSTIANFPKGKPIYTYPTDMTPAGDVQFSTEVKEDLLDELEGYRSKHEIEITNARIDKIEKSDGLFVLINEKKEAAIRAKRVVIAIGRSGNFRKLGVPGEELDKVYNRLHDPKEYCSKDVLVVGGGDSAMEAAIALGACGARVTLSYRKPEFSRPKPENIEKLQSLAADPEARVAVDSPTSERVTTAASSEMRGDKPAGWVMLEMASGVKEIREGEVTLKLADGSESTIPNDAVFPMIGREAPLDFFRRSGININGEWRMPQWIGLVAMSLFVFWIYHWKGDYNIPFGLKDHFNQFLGLNPSSWMSQLKGWWDEPGTLGHTLKISMTGRSFYYTMGYAILVTVFGIRRIRRRKTPYITLQTSSLMAIQVVPLFILPEIILPLMGHNGWFGSGIGQWFADTFFPEVTYGHGREYWRAYGFILAWPLMAWNWFTGDPLYGWLVLGFLQTFVAIPLLIRYWGKGSYCGWICSCGALAETLGDQHRHKMPHGPVWNRLNMIGQVFLWFAVVLMLLRIAGWLGAAWANTVFAFGSKNLDFINYAYFVDLLFAGVIGVAFYFHYSGRIWCRFACPLAALMHIYARFTKFRIFPQKSKCISCNVCTSVCHQGIDIMNFANKGVPMEDPECVRCSACVQSCPTGVLKFGRYGADRSDANIIYDGLAASPVQMAELSKK
ncbi:MAG: NAD(P)-binding domain-containing protein [Verrucomicrobiota bacterium]